jgi:hypothetical protein
VDVAEAWVPVFAAKIEELQGTDPKVRRSSVQDFGGHKFAFVDVTFSLAKSGTVVLRGATTEIEGKNLHVALVAPVALHKLADQERATIAATLEFTNPVAPADLGGTVTNGRASTKLPADWRPLQGNELAAVSPQLLKLGLEDVTGCWTAIKGRPGATPDLMATCSRPLHLGVVDEFSVAEHDELVRAKLFGPSVPPGTLVPTLDRSAMLYVPRDGLAMGVVPDGELVSVTWALGQGSLAEPVRAALQGSTFPVPHATTLGDNVWYWMRHRTFSPVVLCPIGCLCSGVVAIVVLVAGVSMLRGRRDDDEDYA